jgi:hypothetical protein
MEDLFSPGDDDFATWPRRPPRAYAAVCCAARAVAAFRSLWFLCPAHGAPILAREARTHPRIGASPYDRSNNVTDAEAAYENFSLKVLDRSLLLL